MNDDDQDAHESETRIREALSDFGGRGSARDAVLARIGGRVPGRVASDFEMRGLRIACGSAAALVIVLASVFAVAGRGDRGGFDRDPSGARAGNERVPSGGVDSLASGWIAAADDASTEMPWLDGYSGESDVLLAMFEQETTP